MRTYITTTVLFSLVMVLALAAYTHLAHAGTSAALPGCEPDYNLAGISSVFAVNKQMTELSPDDAKAYYEFIKSVAPMTLNDYPANVGRAFIIIQTGSSVANFIAFDASGCQIQRSTIKGIPLPIHREALRRITTL
jgi:alanine-alpha-ketoisovalerate/valine-pyruvate aminotransferase